MTTAASGDQEAAGIQSAPDTLPSGARQKVIFPDYYYIYIYIILYILLYILYLESRDPTAGCRDVFNACAREEVLCRVDIEGLVLRCDGEVGAPWANGHRVTDAGLSHHLLVP